MLVMTSGKEGEMATVVEKRYTGTSLDSIQAAADAALDQVPQGPGGIRMGKFAGLTLQDGGVVGRKQYTVTILAGGPQTDDGESDYS
jgi:hypothetical protein